MSEYSKYAMPMQTFQHPEAGNTVDLVGITHIGGRQYYERIQSFLDGREENGAHIHYEGMTAIERPKQETHAAEERGVRTVKALTKGQDLLLDYTQLIYQDEGLQYRPAWRNVDMQGTEL